MRSGRSVSLRLLASGVLLPALLLGSGGAVARAAEPTGVDPSADARSDRDLVLTER